MESEVSKAKLDTDPVSDEQEAPKQGYSNALTGVCIITFFVLCVWAGFVLEHGRVTWFALTVKLFFIGFSALGAFCSLTFSATTGLGGQWMEGLKVIPELFLALAGALAGIHLLRPIIAACFRWTTYIGSNSAVIASIFIATDMGGNQFCKELSTDPVTRELDVAQYYTANLLGYSLGDLMAFAIPVGLVMLPTQRLRLYFILGTVPGIIATPFGSMVTYAIWYFQKPMVNTRIAADAELDAQLDVNFWRASLAALTPCLALGIPFMFLAKYKVQWLFTLFQRFGDVVNILIRFFFVLAMAQQLGRLAFLFPPWWHMEPLLHGSLGLEIAGSTGCVLSGVYPFIYILRERFRPLVLRVGSLLGFENPDGTLGAFGGMTNTILLFKVIPRIQQKDDIMLACAYVVSAGYSLGDYLIYCSIYQPSILASMLLGKLLGGVFGCYLAKYTVCRLKLPDHFDDEEETSMDAQSVDAEAQKQLVPEKRNFFTTKLTPRGYGSTSAR
mmetsp:Transcript_46419/g.110595  ORF Transcript_46419/g.110595 Transcript_46419/m.110595 type:complete len:500 (-) Transcript_46419:106-1605(-)|eukprot:CAMPEP_0178408724 /NCGR_PEP_ID=MMETSP0689_2-20121128/20090_1 /TAXON_ID=160604 /ORGANISM="Amphidinium massartii, Strain CS-259" /LENGTH=499 /DNA_ID=CAMNT_0020029835 /DNA_START=73 /DNA_END=1572 /DNA_ORIENTATION=-